MTKNVDYYFSLGSPWTYLGHARFETMAQKHNVEVGYRPADYSKIFPISGGLPPAKRAPQRQAYRLMELNRWRDYLGLPLNPQPQFHPVSSNLAAQMVYCAIEQGAHPGKLIGGVLAGVWTQQRDVSDADTLRTIAEEQGYDADSLLDAAAKPEAEAAFAAATQEAIDRNVFGAPTWIVGDDLFWGQDRLEFLERAITGQNGPSNG